MSVVGMAKVPSSPTDTHTHTHTQRAETLMACPGHSSTVIVASSAPNSLTPEC
jgi:hypothetical protein